MVLVFADERSSSIFTVAEMVSPSLRVLPLTSREEEEEEESECVERGLSIVSPFSAHFTPP